MDHFSMIQYPFWLRCASKTSSGPSGSNQPTGFFTAGLEQTDFTSKTFPKKKPFSTFLGKNSTADVDILQGGR